MCWLLVKVVGTVCQMLLVGLYMSGWLITTLGALTASRRSEVSIKQRVGHLILAGALWPLLAAGLVEGLLIVVLAEIMCQRGPRRAPMAPNPSH
jgi:hypothetical protein